jgi:hypothetical protein
MDRVRGLRHDVFLLLHLMLLLMLLPLSLIGVYSFTRCDEPVCVLEGEEEDEGRKEKP